MTFDNIARWFAGRGTTAQTARADLALAEARSLIAAIDRAQAIIEFDLDGTIRTANANFLSAVGYSLAQIQGEHHRIFVEQGYATSHEYARFWQALRSGELQTGRFRRISSTGEPVWIEASYNPVLDAAGAPCRIVKFATDITAKMREAANFAGQIAAISKVQAVIEFDLQARVLWANENFSATTGYALADIQGKHHSMFLHPEEPRGDAYQAFWANLAAGNFDAGRYRRVGKDGGEIWIQASYNPIFDGDGQLWKVVKYATDITAEVMRERDLAAAVAEVGEVVADAGNGDLRRRVSMSGRSGAIAELCGGVNALVESMGRMVAHVSAASSEVHAAASEIASGNENLSLRTESQASSLEETASSMEEIAATVRATAENARQSTALAQNATRVAEEGSQLVSQVVGTMHEIQRSATQIAEITSVIEGIAFQTNILSLNAAVEAARAGAEGRGFAVVATEIRALAQRCAEASKNIRGLISESGRNVDAGAKIAADAGATISRTVESIRQVNRLMADIAVAAAEQSSGIDLVKGAINAMDEATQQNAALVEEAMASARSLEHEADALVGQVSRYRVRDPLPGAEPMLTLVA